MLSKRGIFKMYFACFYVVFMCFIWAGIMWSSFIFKRIQKYIIQLGLYRYLKKVGRH